MPHLYIVCGLPFAGKSTLTRELIRRRGCRRIDIDEINTARGIGIAGATITPRQWAESYAESYRQLATYLAAGMPVAYEGHCGARRQRDHLRAIARARDVATTLIYLDVPEAIVRTRWLANRAKPQRHDVDDHNFALAVALLETPGDDEAAVYYDGTVPVAEWVDRALPG